MSIAELIMQGTNRASESTAWVGDSLAKLGQNVGQSLAQREQQKQAQEMLPFLKQNLQAAMTDAESGKSGQAYSRLLGSIDPQMLNNPQLAPFITLGFDAIGKSTDDYLYKQKATQGSGTTLADMYALQMMGGQLPAGGGGAGGTGESQDVGTPSDALNSTAPLPETDIQAGGARFVEPEGDVTRQQMPGEPVVTSKPPLTYAEAAKARAAKPTPEQEEARAFLQKNQKVAETQGTGKAWYNESVSEDSPKLKELDQTHDQLYFKGADQFQFGTMYFPKEKDLDKEIKITAKGNDFNFSVDRNKVNTELEKERRAFKINITTALERMQSQEIDKLFKEYGSIENFPLPSRGDPKAIKFPIKGKDGKPSFVKLPISGQPDPDGVIKNMGLGDAFTLLQSAPGLGRPIGILIARSGEMPAVGQDRKAMAAKFLSETR